MTLEQFKRIIRKLKKDKAPGPSHLTTNMVKGWPDDMIETAYNLMRHMWHKGDNPYIPRWWGDRLVRPIAKKTEEATAKNTRPVGLLEILRKIWTSAVVTIIHDLWRKNDALNHNQHGYRWRRSTSSAVLEVLNALEKDCVPGQDPPTLYLSLIHI